MRTSLDHGRGCVCREAPWRPLAFAAPAAALTALTALTALVAPGCLTTGEAVTLAVTSTAEAVGRARCDGPITRGAHAEVPWRTGDDRYGAGLAHVGGATSVGTPCGGDVRFAYVRRDTYAGLFTGPVEIRNALVQGVPPSAPPSGAPAPALTVAVPYRGVMPPGDGALHPLTLAAGSAVTLLAGGAATPTVEVWLGGLQLPWEPAPGGGQQEFFVAPVDGTYTVRVRGASGRAYVLLAAPGGTAGVLDGVLPRGTP